MANSKVARSIAKISSILAIKPAMTKQVSTSTLDKVQGSPSANAAVNMTIQNELAARAMNDQYSDSGHSVRTPRSTKSPTKYR